jgi:transposase-like protein
VREDTTPARAPVTRPVTDRDRPRCPHCGEDVLVERDPVSRRFVCLVCAKTWAPAEDGP